ncbi:right-handed parallel beta-helix repeat-containing protein [Puniceicoccus vermicola]|uniref:Right-handed parallel beta-helix repeat-containing protein n=1 Tax=Puniceicoccus vermicola TaxID=388746 RepID=A0A7X1B0E7_9BACT|nr:right-handed parallel beta-helix repeat-containing protein [Puniceicoccus vermicola]MBC2603257.1 right-handed parallel beta-helix repeat-containing protein [Puniceicoccus vermicola]
MNPAKQTLFLSPNGNDQWTGRRSAPNEDRSDGPMATLSAVQEAARRLRKETGKAAQVSVAHGRYPLDRPLTFTPADNGQVWSAAPGARPVFSGGRILSGWTVGEHAGREAWVLDLPEVAKGQWHFTQLWVNGRRRERPCLPKTGFHTFAGMDGQPNSGFAWNQGPTRAEFRPGDIRAFRNLEEVELVAYQLWFDTHHRIQSVDETRNVVHFRQPSLGSLLEQSGEPARYRLINVFEALSEPGEWYLDRTTGRLTYLPMPGETVENTKVVAPRLSECLRFQSTKSEVVADIRLENLAFAHTQWTRSPDHVGSIQAAFDVPGSVVFDRAENCVLFGCEIAHCAGYGVEMLTGCHRNMIASCTIRDLGGGGIKIGHESLEVHEPAVGENLEGSNRRMAATVADCNIHDGGCIYPSAIGIWIGNAGMNRIQHNAIHHFTYTGISFGWVWGYAASSRGCDNRIEYNHIHHINHGRWLSDNGGIYSLGLQSGSKVVGNHIHDIACHHYGGWGLYPDEGSSGILYENNCVHDIQFAGMSIHYGRFLTFQNNIFARMDRAMLGLGREDLSCANRFERNILWFDRDNLGEGADRPASTHATARNVVWNAAGCEGVRWPLGTLTAEQMAGRWLESLELDPLFTNPTGGDFTLREDSPAYDLGFQTFDGHRAGPRQKASMPVSFTDYSLPEAEPIAVAVAGVELDKVIEEENGRRVEAMLRVRNVSELPVSGVYQVLGSGADGRRWEGESLAVELLPGATVELRSSFVVPSDARRFWLMACGDETNLFSGATLVNIPETVPVPALKTWTIPESEDEWISSLADGTSVERSQAGTQILRARVAISGGDQLCLVGEITDPKPVLNEHQPWNGSSLELFLAPETGKEMRRSFNFVLLPPVEDGVAVFRGLRGSSVPEGAIFSTAAAEGVWRFALRMPLSGLEIAPAADGFRMDLIVNATATVAGQNHLRLPIWGSDTRSNLTNSAFLARVKCL